MKRTLVTLAMIVLLMSVAAAPALADEETAAVPGSLPDEIYVNARDLVSGKAGELSAPLFGTVKAQKSGKYSPDNWQTNFTYTNYLLRKGNWGWNWAETTVTDALGNAKTIYHLYQDAYLCRMNMGCTPWWGNLFPPDQCYGCSSLSFPYFAFPAPNGAGFRSVTRHTFAWQWGGTLYTCSAYLVLSAWV